MKYRSLPQTYNRFKARGAYRSRYSQPNRGSDDGYDARKDGWEYGDEPVTETQRRESDAWNEECRRNGW